MRSKNDTGNGEEARKWFFPAPLSQFFLCHISGALHNPSLSAGNENPINLLQRFLLTDPMMERFCGYYSLESLVEKIQFATVTDTKINV